MGFLHKKTVVISTIVFLVFIFLSQPIYQSVMPIAKFDGITAKPAFLLYTSLAHAKHPTRTLLVFANHAEQRLGGGFVGSVGVLNGSEGRLRIESVRSIYYYDHRLEEKKGFIDSPPYLQGLIPSILARDSLISTDSNDNAKLFRDLYARESGEYIDNVVIITPKVLSLLLSYVGPVDLPEYGITVTDKNVLSTLQQEVEAGRDKIAGKDPKTVLKILFERMIIKIPELAPERLVDLSDDVAGLMQTRQLYASLQDQSTMQKLQPYQAPLAKPADMNTFHVATANHIANKSSQAILQSIKAKLQISEDGIAHLRVQITRTHTSDYTGYYIDPRNGQANYIIGDDLSWVQLTLPANSRIISSQGLAQQAQNGVFGMDMLTKPLSKSTTEAEFVLPARYAMLDEVVVDQIFLAQFGWFGQQIDYIIEMPEKYRFSHGSAGVKGEGRSANRQFFQIGDERIQFVFKK